ncbi:hypothetical protein [Pseudomonas sp. BIGb0164]|jgi:hypothetical protein|uniref:hypothetical protein n=1 Tax=Pseudomonas sp. BIGb0164 TaxID=2940605 RepID=UPI002169A1AD|nr:hypothetical protein [Pseudomonas sp. BIGb0164]MCS4249970.1 hypothetical protein [Pseudomonas sp. BIGb0164]
MALSSEYSTSPDIGQKSLGQSQTPMDVLYTDGLGAATLIAQASGSKLPFLLRTRRRSLQTMSTCYSVQITPEGLLPDFYSIAEHLWGIGCNVDSEGDCTRSDRRQWTELTLSLRGTSGERIDIDPLSLKPLTLVIRSSHATLCQRVADYIVSVSGCIEPCPRCGSLQHVRSKAMLIGAASPKKRFDGEEKVGYQRLDQLAVYECKPALLNASPLEQLVDGFYCDHCAVGFVTSDLVKDVEPS